MNKQTPDFAKAYGWTPAGWDAYCAAIDRGAPREVAVREGKAAEGATPAPTLELGRRVHYRCGIGYSGSGEGLVVAMHGEPTGDRGRPGVVQFITPGQMTFDVITFDGVLHAGKREHDIDRMCIGGLVLLDRVHGPAMIARAHQLVAEKIAADNLARVTARENFERQEAARVVVDAPRFYWNGIKDAKGEKLQPAYYSAGPFNNLPDGTITIYARKYRRFSEKVRANFAVTNDSDLMSDYFADDTIRVLPSHPLHAQVAAAKAAQDAHAEKRYNKRRPGGAA